MHAIARNSRQECGDRPQCAGSMWDGVDSGCNDGFDGGGYFFSITRGPAKAACPIRDEILLEILAMPVIPINLLS